MHAWRRERASGWEDSLGNRSGSPENRVRRSGEPGRFPGESRRMTVCRICLFCREFFRVTPCDAVILFGYAPLTIDLQHPARTMASGGRSRQRSERNAFGVIWPPGIMGTWALAAAGQGFTVHNCNKLAARLAAAQARREPCLASSGEEHDHGEPDRHRGRWSAGFSAHLQEHFPDRRALPGRRQANGE